MRDTPALIGRTVWLRRALPYSLPDAHTGASSRGFQDRGRACPGVRRRIATPGARWLAPGRGGRCAGGVNRASAGAPQEAPALGASRQCGKGRAGLELDFVAVGPRPGAVDDEEVACFVERQQRVVPDAGGVVHALVATRQEGPQLPGRGRRTAAATTTR